MSLRKTCLVAIFKQHIVDHAALLLSIKDLPDTLLDIMLEALVFAASVKHCDDKTAIM